MAIGGQTEVKKSIYVHNDLANTAHYFVTRVAEKAKGDREGIGHDIVAALVMLAFAVEAQFNFLGSRLCEDWRERDPALEKIRNVLAGFNIDTRLIDRPHKTLMDLKRLRDAFAHGKPVNVETTIEGAMTEEELKRLGALDPSYDNLLTAEFVATAASDIDEIWKDLLQRGKIDIVDTLSSGTVTYTVSQRR